MIRYDLARSERSNSHLWHTQATTGFQEVLNVAPTLGETQHWLAGRRHVDGVDRARLQLVHQVTQDDAVSQRRANLLRQPNLQPRLDDQPQFLGGGAHDCGVHRTRGSRPGCGESRTRYCSHRRAFRKTSVSRRPNTKSIQISLWKGWRKQSGTCLPPKVITSVSKKFPVSV